jgi:hypothetical protein
MLRSSVDKMPEDLGLDRICCCRILRVPLHTEVPARVILQRHGLDDTVNGVRRWTQASSKCGNALVVVTGDGSATPHDLS